MSMKVRSTLRSNMEKLWSNIDKFLLVSLLMALVGMTVHVMHDPADASNVIWFQQIDGQVLAALLTMMVGSRLAQRNGDGNGNGKNGNGSNGVPSTNGNGNSQAKPQIEQTPIPIGPNGK